MSRTNIATQKPVGPYPASGSVSAAALDLMMSAADAVNHNSFIYTGKEVLLAQNTDTNPHTITLTSAPDEHGRSVDIATYSIGAGKISAFSFRQGGSGWLQADGKVYFEASDVTVKFAIISPEN